MAITARQPQTMIAAIQPTAAPWGLRASLSRLRFPWRQAVKSSEQVFFFSQLALMIEIGTSLTNGLHALAEQSRNPYFKEILLAMLKDLQEGRQLSDAMTALSPRLQPGLCQSRQSG